MLLSQDSTVARRLRMYLMNAARVAREPASRQRGLSSGTAAAERRTSEEFFDRVPFHAGGIEERCVEIGIADLETRDGHSGSEAVGPVKIGGEGE